MLHSKCCWQNCLFQPYFTFRVLQYEYLLVGHFKRWVDFPLDKSNWGPNSDASTPVGGIWITESQSWKGALEVTWSNPSFLKQGHLELVAQNHVQQAFEYLKNEESTTFLGNLCQCSFSLTVGSVSWCPEGTSCMYFSLCPDMVSLNPERISPDHRIYDK